MGTNYGITIAGDQPDGTQGIATVEIFKAGNSTSTPLKQLVGCVIHLSRKDKSLRNILKIACFAEGLQTQRTPAEDDKIILKVEEKNKCFIFVPWFSGSCRPTEFENSRVKIVIKLHRYEKEEGEIEFSVDESKSSEIFEKYACDNYFVIPCPEFKKVGICNSCKTSFFKKWSSELLLLNSPSQVSQISNLFHGFKKETKNNETLFKYCGFDEESELEENGVLLIRRAAEYALESYVIGCYKKENNSIKKYCFLLKGLENIDQARDSDNPPLSGSTEGRSNTPYQGQTPSGSGEGGSTTPSQEQTPSGSGEGGSNTPSQEQTPSGSGEGGSNTPSQGQTPSVSGEGENNTPSQEQTPSGSAEGGSNTPSQGQTPSGSAEGGSNTPSQGQTPSGSSERGSNNHPTVQSPSRSGGGERNNLPTTEQHRSRRSKERRKNPTQEQTVQTSQQNPEQSQESVDGRTRSSELVVHRQQPNLPRNQCEARVTNTEKKELIHNTFGPKVEDMPHTVTHEVGLMLNPKQKILGNDYRKVAGKLKLRHYKIRNLPKENPMEGVFEVMIGNAMKVADFVDILVEIERYDVVNQMYDMARDQ